MNWQLKRKIVDRFQTQVDFANHLGVSESIVSYVVRGRKELLLEEQRLWAKELNCERDEVF